MIILPDYLQMNVFLIFRFNSRQNQARRSLVLRKNEEVLAYPQCLRGNFPLSDANSTLWLSSTAKMA